MGSESSEWRNLKEKSRRIGECFKGMSYWDLGFVGEALDESENFANY